MFWFGEFCNKVFAPPPQNWDLFSNFPQFPVILPCLNLCSLFLTNWVPKGVLCFDPPNLPIWWILQQGFGFFSLKGSVRYFWCWTYVKWGYLKFHPLKGFFDTIIRSACRSQNVVLPLTRSPWEPFFPLFFPLIAIPYELEIFPLRRYQASFKTGDEKMYLDLQITFVNFLLGL